MRLATRNVFLNRSLSAKIAGFGPRQGDDDDESGKKVCVDFVGEKVKEFQLQKDRIVFTLLFCNKIIRYEYFMFIHIFLTSLRYIQLKCILQMN